MTLPRCARHRLTLWLGLLAMLATGCQVLENRIGDPTPSIATPESFTTATPGGRISVWLQPSPGATEAGSADSTPLPSDGQIVGPAATATAAAERIAAATATASAPLAQPVFGATTLCPRPTNLSPPVRPSSFVEYPQVINVYFSNGGAAAVLESTLRDWGAITDQGGMVQANTDLTGDKVPEIIVLLYNPSLYNPEAVLNAGRLLIYGCENNVYRLLYATSDSPNLALPVLHRVGDMNGDVKAEVVYDVETCNSLYCLRNGYILSWNPVVGLFETLNNREMVSINGRLGVVDIDSDGVLEVLVRSQIPLTSSSGPTRGVIDYWDFTGLDYSLARREPDEQTRYRIHVLQDADEALLAGDLNEATRLYQEARDNDRLLLWTLPNEGALLRAYALYRLTTVYARRNNLTRAGQALDALRAENPPGSPGAAYAAMAEAFMGQLTQGANISSACQAALGTAAAPAQVLATLNSFGTANRRYQPGELCPF